MVNLLPYLVDKIERAKLRYEIHRFDSGAIMVDIWLKDSLCVVQIEEDLIGVSLVSEQTVSFDTIPDRSFTSEKDFKAEFETIF